MLGIFTNLICVTPVLILSLSVLYFLVLEILQGSADISKLTHFKPIFHFYTPRKHQKTCFLMFPGGREIERHATFLEYSEFRE